MPMTFETLIAHPTSKAVRKLKRSVDHGGSGRTCASEWASWQIKFHASTLCSGSGPLHTRALCRRDGHHFDTFGAIACASWNLDPMDRGGSGCRCRYAVVPIPDTVR